MTIQLLQRAKFALLYENKRVVETDEYDGLPYIDKRDTESPLAQPAIFDLMGLRVQTETPTSATHAAKINERVDAIMEMTLQEMRT